MIAYSGIFWSWVDGLLMSAITAQNCYFYVYIDDDVKVILILMPIFLGHKSFIYCMKFIAKTLLKE